MTKQKILIVHNYYQIPGGEDTVVANEKKMLEEHGHEVVLYTRHNSELKTMSKFKKLFLPFTTIFNIKTYRDIKKIIKNGHIDIVHCHNTFPIISPSVYYATRKCKISVVQTIHNFRFLCPNGVFYRNGHICEDCLNKGLSCSLIHGCYKNSKIQTLVVVNMLRFHRLIGTYKKINYIFLTNFNRRKFNRLLDSKLEKEAIKPNFEYINLPSLTQKRKEHFVFIGRLDKNKGIDFLIESWPKDKELYIFGNGMLEETVRKACEENKNIHYMGFRPQEEIWVYLGTAKAMMFPTDLYEGFPMTLIESFALGTPVICSNIGNGADIVNNAKAGVSFKTRNKKDLYRAIFEVESNFEIYSKNAKNAYEMRYNPEANYQKLKSIYDAIQK